ncbi:tetratricopeptide repeat protein [Patescibacteria group bacterium]|jgi:cytochrome c-type biogenesis protein CcmH/NrfG|nr:tetratricopeptide repeat protein [Patescibacteria group bacterium]
MDYIYRPNSKGTSLGLNSCTSRARASRYIPFGRPRLGWRPKSPRVQIPTRLVAMSLLCLLVLSGMVWGGKQTQEWIVARKQAQEAEKLAQTQAQWEEARAAISQQAKSARDALSLGQQFQANGEAREAVAAYEIAVQIEPNWRDALLCLGQAYTAIKEYDKAEETLEHALRIDPINPTTHNLLASLYQKTGRGTLASTALKKADQLASETGQQIGG